MTRYGKYLNRNSIETTDEEGTTTTITDPCGYYVEMTFDNMPEKIVIKDEPKIEAVEIEKEETVDSFEEAMQSILKS